MDITMSIAIMLMLYFAVVYGVSTYSQPSEEKKIELLEKKITEVISRKKVSDQKLDDILSRIENIVCEQS